MKAEALQKAQFERKRSFVYPEGESPCRWLGLKKTTINMTAKKLSLREKKPVLLLCFITDTLIMASVEVQTSSPVKIYHVWWPL